MRMTTKEVATELGTTEMWVRKVASKGNLPFAIVCENKKKNSYMFDRERFELWKKGEL